VDLNMFPPSNRVVRSSWNVDTDGVEIMRNALLY
jgi:hypothetical protein